ncbi:MAG: hypothetical protein WA936_04405 [Erythrobacter sp.]|uniref:hypothetical protein n=1 Tax=Erythrobacter sp. TaxID=1042 RepID=UPI003C71345C
MALLLALPHEDTYKFIDSYGTYDDTVPENNLFVSNLIAFNPSGASIRIDGAARAEKVLFCVTHEPAQVRYEGGVGTIFFIRLRGGAFDRLLHIDPADGATIVSPDPERHGIILDLASALEVAMPSPASVFAAFDRILCSATRSAKPTGLAERYYRIVCHREGDISIAETVGELGCTIRTLERACRKRFGRTPKRIARGYRAAATYMRELREGGRPELSGKFAFADLAHYANDIRELTGLTRTDHFRQTAFDASLALTRVWPDASQATTEDSVARWNAEYRRRAHAAFAT